MLANQFMVTEVPSKVHGGAYVHWTKDKEPYENQRLQGRVNYLKAENQRLREALHELQKQFAATLDRVNKLLG